MFTLKSREKERDLRLQKKAELQMRVATDNYNQVKTVFDKMNAQVSSSSVSVWKTSKNKYTILEILTCQKNLTADIKINTIDDSWYNLWQVRTILWLDIA